MNYLALAVSILAAQLAGIVGAGFTANSIPTWYATIIKPVWTPPSWLFGPVWIFLYTLMGVATYMVWMAKKSKKRTRALEVYGVQLVFNALWSILFFGLQNPGLALVEIGMLWVLIVLTIDKFYRVKHMAGLLLLPYLIWVSFAAVLNFSIWQLN